MSELPPVDSQNLRKRAAIDALWRRSVLHWKLDKNQLEMYKFSRNTDHKIIVIGSSRQLGKCIEINTLVPTVQRGLVPIQNLIEGEEVYGYNKDGSISPSKIRKVFDSGIKEVVDLTHRGVVWATSSLDHGWLTTKNQGKTYEHVKVKDFKPDTKIRRVFIDMPGGGINEPHAYAIGALLGDGCSKQKYNYITISSEDEQVPAKVASILNLKYKHSGSNNFNWHIGNLLEKGKHTIPAYCAYYEEWCKNKYAHEKIIDLDIIKTWNRESQLSLLAGLIDTDGCVQKHGNELTVSFSGQSKSIVETVQYLLLYHFQYNTKTLIDNRSKYKNGPLHYVSITNNLINKRIIKTLTPYLAKDKKKWKEEYEVCPEHNTNQDYIGFKLENKRHSQCYDISIDNETSLYALANGLITHNSYFLATLAIEECLRNPFIIVKFIAPKVKDIKRIITPLIREITSDCPQELRPDYKSQDHTFKFKNGSEIQLAGTDNGHAESIRGNKAHLCIIDEAGFCDDLSYIVNSILIPTTTTTGGKIVMASTPSKSPDHDFMRFMEEAELENRFIKKTIYDNPRLTTKEIEDLAEALGGVDSNDFKREYLVQKIKSEEDAVVPEFNEELKIRIVKEHARPPFFDTYIAMDIGVKDLTVVLFAYYDFKAATLVIEDELVLSGVKMLTDSLAEKIREKEATLWTNKMTGEVKTPTLRIADNNNLLLLNDLAVKHNFNFLATAKDNKEAALNNMRMLLRSGRIAIHPRCKTLIVHLEGALWNKARTSYIRSADKGHYDAVDALTYMCRNVYFNRNPYPANWDTGGGHNYFMSDELGPKTDLEKNVVKMFQSPSQRKFTGFGPK